MKLIYKQRIYFLKLFFITCFSYSQVPTIQWQKSIGGTNQDYGYSIIQTNDAGYIVSGYTLSNNGDVSGNHGNYDYLVIKLSSIGLIEWQKCFGGIGSERSYSIKQTNDGGFIVGGYADSNNGDVTGNHGNGDYWIVKLNTLGIIEWQKCFGGSSYDFGYDIFQTTDLGYIVTGITYSNNGDVTGNHGNGDAWVIKLTSFGILEWQKCFGGSSTEYFNCVQQTNDNGYILVGESNSNNGDVTGNNGDKDYWIIKLTSSGILEWQKCFGGSSTDTPYQIKQTIDGGYIISGQSDSNNGNVTGNHGSIDAWIVKINTTGGIEWQKSLGGTGYDSARSIIQTSDGNFVIGGYSGNNNGDITQNNGNIDYWIVKLSILGEIIWQKSIGGANDDLVNSIINTSDNGFILTGSSLSNDIDVTGNYGDYDYWIVKLSPDNLVNNSFTENTTITLFPNPAKEKIILKLNYFTPSQEITITNIQGKIIHTQKLEGLSTTINTSSFEKGIYFLNLIDDTQKTTKKFIIE